MYTTIKRASACLVIGVALLASAPVQALLFNLTSTGNANADAGFQAAANYWQSQFSDNVTVNITAGFAALAPGILGQAGSSYVTTNLSTLKSALAADATSANDATMVAGLPVGATYSKYINGTLNNAGAAHLEAGVSQLQMTTANAKAIGLLAANNPVADASITFSSQFAFDFNRSDGIGAGLYDFIGIAIHELGHAMGFTSGVDILDTNSNGTTGQFSDTAFDPYATVLDFTRCSATSQAAGANMDWTIGTAQKDFAINGSCTALISNAWSTGVNFGDGRQASHWKDNLGIGMFDPTAAPTGALNVVTANDLMALDVIGWNSAVPEPSSLLLFGVAALGMVVARRRKSIDGGLASPSARCRSGTP